MSKKELSQPFGLSDVANYIKKLLNIKTSQDIDVMGIINANEDSFFKGSRFSGSLAVTQIEKMIDEGATIIDIGGVSSRPNSVVVDVDDELQRVKPIVEAIYENKLYEKATFSIDSYAPKVIDLCLSKGFRIVNDITGLRDDEVCRLCGEYDATAVIMHMQGTPQTMQIDPSYVDILDEIYSFFKSRIEKANSFGISDIILDIGIGFGKKLDDNLLLLKHLEHFLSLDKRLLVGASRKSMIDMIDKSLVEDRLAGTLALHLEAYKKGASILRVHDVKEHIQAIKVTKALQNI